ncbi:MAG: MerR family DNA-binding transcriptional regulator [Patescibacteria group bacterium]
MDFNQELITIGEATKQIGVSIDTMRRWDKTRRLTSVRGKNNYRYYKKEKIEKYMKKNIKDTFKIARSWVLENTGSDPRPEFYCKESPIFQARLIRLKEELSKMKKLKDNYFSIISIVGEIGDNSFAHNFGNWPDVMGLFFAYNLTARKIVLADRGQGVLKTLKKVKPELNNNLDALETAFTEVISGRSPEARGNGLKYVRKMVTTNEMELFFQTGDAKLKIKKDDLNLNIQKSSVKITGCLVLIKF